MSNNLQIVYVLTNPAMPGLLKIGSTTQEEVDTRMKQLYSTGVPVPFDCAFACRVPNAREVEKALHTAFRAMRINPTREFFKIEPECVIAILNLLHIEPEDDITAQIERRIEAETTQADLKAAETLKQARRPRIDYLELGIPVGSVLHYEDGTQQAIVHSSRLVEFAGQVSSLTSATRKIRQLADDYPLQPSPYWTYNGETLKDIYDSFYALQDEA